MVSDELVSQVFNDPDHHLNEVLRHRFGHDVGSGIIQYNPSKAELRRHLETLREEGKIKQLAADEAKQLADDLHEAGLEPGEPVESAHYMNYAVSMEDDEQRSKAVAVARKHGAMVVGKSVCVRKVPKPQEEVPWHRDELRKPPLETGHMLFQNGFKWEKPVKVHDWSWSGTFGAWAALVTFADGWHGYSYPKTY